MEPQKPAEVEVVNEGPLKVEVIDEKLNNTVPIEGKDGKMSLPPKTTAQEDIVVGRQAFVSLIWESVQGIISIGITGAVIYCQINSIQSETLNNAFFFVIATYLQRSNHVKIGGVGQKANEEVYRGR